MVFVILFAGLMSTVPAFAEDNRIKRDTDADGKIDQIAYVDKKGNPIRLEIDSNGDGLFDKYQFYQDGKMVNIESDRDHDGIIDTRDYFEKEKRVRHERIRPESGELEQVILFDDQERPMTMKRDTTADGRFDTCHEFEAGRLARSTRDTDGSHQMTAPPVSQTQGVMTGIAIIFGLSGMLYGWKVRRSPFRK